MLENILEKIPNDNPVVIHSDLLIFGKTLNDLKSELPLSLEKYFDKGIFLPSFTLKNNCSNFDNNDNESGSLTNLFIKKKNFKRTFNPMHSYIYNNHFIIEKKYFIKSFGKKSIFEFFNKNNFNWINLGANVKSGFSIFHHCEEIAKVKYREYMPLNRSIIYKKKFYNFNYKYFGRKDLSLNTDYNIAVSDLIKNE